MNTNVTNYEGASRLTFAIIINVAVLLVPHMPPWVALLSIYPFFSALIGWDPFYAAFNALWRTQEWWRMRERREQERRVTYTMHNVSA